MRRSRTPRGFTLLELLGALGLVAVLLCIALPRVSAALPGILLDGAARRLASDVRLARVRAIGSGHRARLVIEMADARWSLELDDGQSFVPESGHRSLPGAVRFDAARSSRVRSGRISITFQPRGHTTDNATIALASAGGGARHVLVSTAGRVRVQ